MCAVRPDDRNLLVKSYTMGVSIDSRQIYRLLNVQKDELDEFQRVGGVIILGILIFEVPN